MSQLEIIFYYIPVLFCFFAAGALLIKQGKQLAQKYLCGFLVVMGMLLLTGTLRDVFVQSPAGNNILYFFSVLFNILCAILVLFYFVSLMQPQRLTRRYFLVFGILVLLYMFVMCIPELLEHTASRSISAKNFDTVLRLLGVACDISIEIYTITTVTVMYYRHRRFIRENYSYEEGINFRWVFISNGILIWAAISGWIWGIKGNADYSIFFNLNILIIVWIVFLLGYKKRQVPLPKIIDNSEKAEEALSFVAPPARQVRTKEALMNYFDKEKPYLNSSLSLVDIATAIDSKPAYLSRLINNEFNTNFYTFVNNCRLDYAILLMQEQKKDLIIKNLYLDAGFKSRSVFYRLFRERTGFSPKGFLAKQDEMR